MEKFLNYAQLQEFYTKLKDVFATSEEATTTTKGLMSSSDKTKLDGIESGAQMNVKPDWNAAAGSAAEILNKPNITSTIDDELSPTSTNPVQNKAIKAGLDGKVDKTSAGVNEAINLLSEGTSTPGDADYYISQYVGGGTTTTTYHRRPMSALLAYIKSKLATVATSGSYNDLSNKPTIPTTTASVTSGSAAALTSGGAYTALAGKAASSHAHGNITSAGDITTTVAIASGDRIVINDESASKVNNSSITFGTSTTTFLANNGTWQTPAGKLTYTVVATL